MFNPVLVSKSSPFQTEESCLSLEGSRPTKRYESIEVAYLDEQWMPKQLSFLACQPKLFNMNWIIWRGLLFR